MLCMLPVGTEQMMIALRQLEIERWDDISFSFLDWSFGVILLFGYQFHLGGVVKMYIIS